jgi:hypothetical protein
MDKKFEDLAWLGEHLVSLVAVLKRHHDISEVEAEHSANVERLESDERRLIDVHKTQARAELAAEADAIRAQAAADAAKIMAERQAKVEAADAEVRTKRKEFDRLNGECERLQRKIEEFHRVRQSLAG